MGGDFETLLHVGTGALYRHNLTLAQYNPEGGAQQLKLIEDHAGGANKLRKVPGELTCKICGTKYVPEAVCAVAEDAVDVFVVVGSAAA